MKNPLKCNKGAALAIVLIVFVVVSIIGTVVLSMTLSQNSLSVSSEDTTQAYYYARSAIDIVSTDINQKSVDLAAAEAALQALDTLNPPPTQAEADAVNAAYASALANIQKVVPTSGSLNVQVSGIMSSPVTVTVSNASGAIQLDCSVTYDGLFSSAKAKIGSFTAQPSVTVTITPPVPAPTWLGTNSVYSWGTVSHLGSKFVLDNIVNNTGMIAAFDLDEDGIPDISGNFDSGIVNTTPVEQDMPIIVPPALTDRTGVSLNGARTLTATDNGIYGALNSQITWTVDITSGDVIFVFSSLTLASDSTINVIGNGSGNLYIYVKEQYANPPENHTLMSFGQDIRITYNNNNNAAPRVYFIAYNDVMQEYVTRTGFNVMPAADVAALDPGNNDTVTMDKDNILSAYFYLPGCAYSSDNNGNDTTVGLYGSIAASSFTFHNKTHISFWAIPYQTLFPSTYVLVGGTGSGEPVKVTYIPYILSYNRIWIR